MPMGSTIWGMTVGQPVRNCRFSQINPVYLKNTSNPKDSTKVKIKNSFRRFWLGALSRSLAPSQQMNTMPMSNSKNRGPPQP